MRAILQRVSTASVQIDGRLQGAINAGLLVLLGVGKDDKDADLQWTVDKIANLRVFPDETGKMNRSIMEIQGEILVVSQFTLYGDCRQGRRPGFSDAASPELANAH